MCKSSNFAQGSLSVTLELRSNPSQNSTQFHILHAPRPKNAPFFASEYFGLLRFPNRQKEGCSSILPVGFHTLRKTASTIAVFHFKLLANTVLMKWFLRATSYVPHVH